MGEMIYPASLSLGEHQITLSATNSAALTGAALVSLYIVSTDETLTAAPPPGDGSA